MNMAGDECIDLLFSELDQLCCHFLLIQSCETTPAAPASWKTPRPEAASVGTVQGSGSHLPRIASWNSLPPNSVDGSAGKNTYINHMEIIWKSYGNHMKSFYNPFIIQWTLFVAPGLSFVLRIREKSNQAPLGARRCAANPCSALLLWPKEADFLGKRILLQNWIPFWTPTVG